MATRVGNIDGELAALLAEPIAGELWKHTESELVDRFSILAGLMLDAEIVGLRIIEELAGRGGAVQTSSGPRTLSDWLAIGTTMTMSRARTLVAFARALHTYPGVLTAYAAGEITTAQAKLIVEFLDHPPHGMPQEHKNACRDALLTAARDGDLRAVRMVREVLRQMFDRDDIPPGEDRGRNELRASKTLHGRVAINGNVDSETGEMLLAALSPLTTPRPEADGERDRRPAVLRRADALHELLRRYLTTGAPADGGGERPQVNIHIGLAELLNTGSQQENRMDLLRHGRYRDLLDTVRLGWADWIGTLSAATIRRIACDCVLTPIGMDGRGVPINVGRSHRLANRAQRRALAARDGGCAFPLCDRPVAWTQAHHVTHWADGGDTDLDNLVLLCGEHHSAIHHGGWEVVIGHERAPLFLPPPMFDPLRRWRSPSGKVVDPAADAVPSGNGGDPHPPDTAA